MTIFVLFYIHLSIFSFIKTHRSRFDLFFLLKPDLNLRISQFLKCLLNFLIVSSVKFIKLFLHTSKSLFFLLSFHLFMYLSMSLKYSLSYFSLLLYYIQYNYYFVIAIFYSYHIPYFDILCFYFYFCPFLRF